MRKEQIDIERDRNVGSTKAAPYTPDAESAPLPGLSVKLIKEID